MAPGILHTTASLILAGAAVPHFGLDHPDLAAASVLAGLWSVVVQPDLDQLDNSGYYGLYIWDKTAPSLSFLWRLYWMPYARMFKHRSFFTHFPIVGTLIRLVYGGWWFLWILPEWSGASVFVALVIGADTLHWVMDWKIWGAFRLFTQG